MDGKGLSLVADQTASELPAELRPAFYAVWAVLSLGNAASGAPDAARAASIVQKLSPEAQAKLGGLVSELAATA